MATTYIVGNDGTADFQTIQEAVDAAVDGDTIQVLSGFYREEVAVDVAVTLVGANQGVSGTGVRGDESTVSGGFTILADSVVVDGFTIRDFHRDQSEIYPDGIVVQTDNVVIRNNVIAGTMNDGHGVNLSINDDPTNSNLTLESNLIRGWLTGAYIYNSDGDVTITGNRFVGNKYAFYGNNGSESSLIDNNIFRNSGAVHLFFSVLPKDKTYDISTFIGNGNIFDEIADGTFQNRPISVYIPFASTGNDRVEVIGTREGDFMEGYHQYGVKQIFRGGAGDDYIEPRTGFDWLDGGRGDDILDGRPFGEEYQEERDTFIFRPGSDHDRILGFEDSDQVGSGHTDGLNDIIKVIHYGISTVGDIGLTQVGNDLVLGFTGNDTVTLKGYLADHDVSDIRDNIIIINDSIV